MNIKSVIIKVSYFIREKILSNKSTVNARDCTSHISA